MKITIEGFENKDQANEFIHWMCNSGEQDFMTSFECSEFWTGTYPISRSNKKGKERI
jgi:acyl CoA:acetate/3-ketoacid CoA transferase alpha subunit